MKNKNNTSPIYTVLILITIILFVVFGICIYLAIHNSNFEMIDYISVTSSFSVAILTIIYVYASTKQMHVMELQLDEMKSEHLTKDHPILVLSEPVFKIEQPRFFYFPPGNSFSFQSRYFFDALLINASDDPGICVNIEAKIIIPVEPQDIVIQTANERFSISSSKSKPRNVRFLFVDDLSCHLFEAIRDLKRIQIETTTYYQNISGGCFSVSNIYYLDMSTMKVLSDQNVSADAESIQIDPLKVIRKWHTAIVQAPAKYREKLEYLKKIVDDESQRAKYRRTFDEIKGDLSSMLEIEDNLGCKLYERSGAFKLTIISQDEFDKRIEANENWKKELVAKNSPD